MNNHSIFKEIIDSHLIEKHAYSLLSKGKILQRNVEDFIQEMYLIILEIPEDKLLSLYEKKQLNYYIITIIDNQSKNPNSTFNKVHRHPKERCSCDFITQCVKNDDDEYYD